MSKYLLLDMFNKKVHTTTDASKIKHYTVMLIKGFQLQIQCRKVSPKYLQLTLIGEQYNYW